MNLSTAITNVRGQIEDAGIRYYTDADIQEVLQDGYYFSTILSNTIEKTVNLPYQSNSPYYNLSELIPDFYALVALFDNQRGSYLSYASRNEMRELQPRYELWSGISRVFCVVDSQRVLILPNPASGTFKVFYRAFGTELSSTSTFHLPKSCEEVPQYWAMAELLEQAQEYEKADYWHQMYFTSLFDAKDKIYSRALPALLQSFKETKF